MAEHAAETTPVLAAQISKRIEATNIKAVPRRFCKIFNATIFLFSNMPRLLRYVVRSLLAASSCAVYDKRYDKR